MDPYLEGSIWHAVHNGLIYQLAKTLSDHVPDDLFVDTEVKTILVDEIGAEYQQMYPNVAVYKRRADDSGIINEPPHEYGGAEPATLTISHLPIKTQSIKVIEIESRRVITAVEVISPVNKFGFGFEEYENKVDALHTAGVNVLEIDLIRRGKRRYQETSRQVAPYCITLFEALRHASSIWLLQLLDPLPTIKVPLRGHDSPVPIDLQEALSKFYADRKLGKRIDYTQATPPPKLTAKEQASISTLLG